MVKHIVLLKPRTETTSEQMEALMEELSALPGQIDGVMDYSGGAEINAGARSQGYTWGFAMTMRDAEANAAYQPHPAHQKVAARVRELNEAVLAFDYEHE